MTQLIGIPILNGLEHLRRCLNALDLEGTEILIINNNVVDAEFNSNLRQLAAHRQIRVLNQIRNIGVAASWNLILRQGLMEGRSRVFIGSNDTILHPGSLKAALMSANRDETIGIWHLSSFNFFLVNLFVVDAVGWFDENFYPAYKEDQDYVYRCELANVKRADVPGSGAEHIGSATIMSDAKYRRLNEDTHFNWNRNHYLMKWGGDAGDEQFRTPYNRKDVDVRWWPDPGGSIEARNWDRHK